MAIASTLQADFSEFVAETRKANAAMQDMQGAAASTSGAMGGVATSMDKAGAAAAAGEGSTLKLVKGFGAAEGALAAFGVQGVSQISNLGSLAQSAAGAATSFGLVGAGAAVVGTALGAWNLGRYIAEANGLDRAMANLAATLMGWGSVSKETAGAQQDIIDRAKALTGQTYDLATATKVVADHVKDQQAQFVTSANLTKKWDEELRNARGGVASLRSEIEAGNLTQDQLKAKYQLSTEAVQYLTREMGKEKTARKELEAAAKKQTEEMQKEAEERVKNADRAQKIAGDANRAWNTEVMTLSGTTTQALIANIDKWRDEQIAALDATTEAAEADYAAIEQVAGEKLALVKLNWDVLKEGSIATFADQAARAEATYQRMLASSTKYTTDAIANALKLRDETLAAYDAVSGAHSAAYAEFLKRDQAYAAALKGFQADATTGAQAKWDAEAAAMDKAIAYSQTYGVTIDAAKQALGQMGDAGAKAGTDTGQAMAGAAQQVSQLTAVVQQSAAQMQTLARVYDQMAQRNIESGSALGTQIGMNYEESARQLRAKAGRVAQYEEALTPTTWGRGGMTSTTTTLNVNVNNPNAGNIANALVTEMRHSGVRFG